MPVLKELTHRMLMCYTYCMHNCERVELFRLVVLSSKYSIFCLKHV